MTSKRIAAFFLACAMGVSGCATVTRGTTDNVQFTSVPSGATATTSLGTSCVTPCQMIIKRTENFTTTFQRQSQKRVVRVSSEVASEGVAAGVGNVLAGGIIGVAVDAGSGATRDLFPNPVHANFNAPANQAQAIALAHAKRLKSVQGREDADTGSGDAASGEVQTASAANTKDDPTSAADAVRSSTNDNGLSRPWRR